MFQMFLDVLRKIVNAFRIPPGQKRGRTVLRIIFLWPFLAWLVCVWISFSFCLAMCAWPVLILFNAINPRTYR